MSFFEFPHTRTYDSDLGWLIKSMEELINQMEELKSWEETHKEEYDQLNKRVRVLENSINSFMNEIDERFNELEADLRNEIYVEIQNALSVIYPELANMSAQISELKAELTRYRLVVNGQIQASEELLKIYIDGKIQDLINSIPDLTTVNVFNPVKGYVTSIQEAVNDLYDLGRSEGITAAEYDALGITASDYDALELTAFQYDQWARYYLELAGFIKNPFHYMASPFTGEIVPLQNVISDLAALHKLYALTASEYDNKELTASDYDALQLGAYDYDWHAAQLIS